MMSDLFHLVFHFLGPEYLSDVWPMIVDSNKLYVCVWGGGGGGGVGWKGARVSEFFT